MDHKGENKIYLELFKQMQFQFIFVLLKYFGYYLILFRKCFSQFEFVILFIFVHCNKHTCYPPHIQTHEHKIRYLLIVLQLLQGENMLVEIFLKLLVRIVDVELLKVVDLKRAFTTWTQKPTFIWPKKKTHLQNSQRHSEAKQRKQKDRTKMTQRM